MRLLERDHPLEVLDDHARRAAAGDGSVVLVAGEAGLGKTTLLRAFADRAPAPVLWGVCDSLSTPRPLGPVRDVAADLGPEVTAVLRDATAQHEIFATVLAALGERPHVLVVDDLHWADEATILLWHRLSVATLQQPLLLIASSRPPVGRKDVARLRMGIERRGGDIIDLAPMPEMGVTGAA
jgi:predicted ATPase